MGMVEISGLAVGPYTMIAPITGRPCYYYRTVAWEWKQNGKNKNWVKVAAECMHVPFFVDDNTGRVLVDPRGADLDLHRDFQQEFNDSFFSSSNDAPGNVNSFLARHGVVTSNKIKIEEFCIKPKNSLFILGTLTDNPGIEVTPQPIRDAEPVNSFSAQGFSLSINSLSFATSGGAHFDTGSPSQMLANRSEPHAVQIIHLSGESAPANTAAMTQQQKIAAALRKAGIGNPAAWAAANVTDSGLSTPGAPVITDPTLTSRSRATGSQEEPEFDNFDPRPPVILMKGSNNKTFLISWRSQQDVARSLGWKCTLMIWGGPLLAILSLYFFLGIKNLF